MSPAEIVCGHVFGTDGALPPPISTTISVRRALEDAVRPALLRQPCVVAFSGGRDSSLVLAVAIFLARRDGLPDPVPVTYVFPDQRDTEEGEWQEVVIRHLRVQEWQRVPIHDELDLVGPLAQEHLVRDGVLWPTTLARDVPLLEIAGGGSLLDGEGGDEVLGVINHRIAPLAGLVRHPRRLRPGLARSALEALGPADMRIRRAQRFWGAETTPWLREPGREMLLETLALGERERPLAFDASVRRVPAERHHVLAGRNRRLRARIRDVEVHSPLVHPEVVHALARQGGRMGPGSRTDVLRTLVPDLLPDEVLARTTKADFTDAYLSSLTRDFAAGWDGQGVDQQLVDAEELRRSWLGAEPNALTAALLQQAWLACLPRG
jgi:hypothetical protein